MLLFTGDYEYKEYNDKKHKSKEYYDYICKECGETIKTVCETTFEEHEFNSRGQCYCGYEETAYCEHKRTTQQLENDSGYVYYSEQKHSIEYYYEIICKDCEEVIDETSKVSYAKHKFDYNGKCECGYSQNSSCKHTNVKDYYSRSEYTENYTKSSHEIKTYYNRVCKTCGETIDEVYNLEQEEHTIKNGKCTKCGCKENCNHTKYDDIYSKSKYTGEYTTSKHLVTNYYDRKCTNCGQKLSVEKETVWAKHKLSKDGECDCGYSSPKDELVDEDSKYGTITEEDTTPYAYPTNLQEGMEVIKGSYTVNVLGNEHCDGIRLNMYSTTMFNDGLSEWYNFDGNDVSATFDCTDVGYYTLMVETRNDTTGETAQYALDFNVVDTTTGTDLLAYFMLGIWDGVVDTGKGLWSTVAHPIKSAKDLGSGISFLAKALTPWGGEERQAILDLWVTLSYDIVDGVVAREAKETARSLGKFTAEILIAVALEKGASKAVEAIKESAKTGKLSKVGKAWVKTKDKVDDFVVELVASSKILNQFDDVVAYIKKHGKLPDNYITKKEARKLGWKSEKGNLADVLPGKSIGGDIYANKPNVKTGAQLPDAIGRVWYEADINYTSGYRGNDRLLYSNDGLFYKTSDHYESFIKIGD